MAKIFRIRDIRKTLGLLESMGLNLSDINARPREVLDYCSTLSREDISLRIRRILDMYVENAHYLIENSGEPIFTGSLK